MLMRSKCHNEGIIGSYNYGFYFQMILGNIELMSLLHKPINLVVVALIVATVGLAAFSYGFPRVQEDFSRLHHKFLCLKGTISTNYPLLCLQQSWRGLAV